ncbi:MAG: NAD-glutamate dehydrogenase [Syntrophobacterales bacterium]|nr:NAD-glutamate dehydrogenase [Syntrophobacterales bacterium]
MSSLNDIAARSILSLDKLVRIEEYIVNTGYMNPEKARREMEWFIIDLGLDEYYFRTTSETDIARQLISLSASEFIARHGGGSGAQLISEREDQAVYIVDDVNQKTLEIEERIEKNYPAFHLESYITRKTARNSPFRFYVLTKPAFTAENKKGAVLSFEGAADVAFFSRAVPETVTRYREFWERMNTMEVPHISVSLKPETDETRIMIGVKGSQQRRLLTTFAHLVVSCGLTIRRKYVEPFADEKKIASFYFSRLPDNVVGDLTRSINVSLMLPDDPVTALFHDGLISAQTTMYAISAAAFTHHFLSLLTEEYQILLRALKDQPEARGIAYNMKMHLIKDTYSTTRISDTIAKHLKVVEMLFNHFELRFKGGNQELCVETEKHIRRTLEREVLYGKERAILNYFLMFNNSIQKTNFYNKEKACMAYRLDPGIVDPVDFPEKIFGLFLLIGHDFHGFHVRFRDIARGGIRIVKSPSIDLYAHNIDTIFTENYNLALTQQRKNKDIPEGGAKGTILLNRNSQEFAERAFKDYIDGLLDLLIETDEKGNTQVREILFFGPDEGSAGFMDWAALHARSRGYPFWKAFSTGKTPELGGIPHDLFGMTTNGIHEYVLGVLKKHGLREEDVVKIQTGGPDGDLGSNEILISKDQTIAIVDGSGVLYDSRGLNREELIRLAQKRVMVEKFDREKLSREGFFISVNDRDVSLPDGELVKNGEEFRNNFHLGKYAVADLFVPCGGRPGAINIGNWKSLLDDRGRPKFRFIVEGANLFITEDARLRLEEQGIVVIKDASTNKGGVTSSSFEVFVSLAMSDEEYNKYLRVQKDKISPFRQAYVEWIIQTIRTYARSEFELLWQERTNTKSALTTLSNAISDKINRLADSIRESPLADDPAIREKIMREYAPRILLELLGLDTILKRAPVSYIKAITANKMATDFVYGRGLYANEVDFAAYVESLKK